MESYDLLKNSTDIIEIVTDNHKCSTIIWFYHTPVKLDRVNFSLLPIHGLRDSDYIFLVDDERSRKAWKWAKDFHCYSDSQVRFYKLDEKSDSNDEEIFKSLKEFENRTDCVVVNMHNLKETRNPCERLNIKTYGNKMDLLLDKRWLHSCVPGSKYYQRETEVFKVKTPSFPKEKISIPRGYSCYSKEELLKAKELLSELGIKKLFLKSANSIGGCGSYPINSEEEFDELLSTLDFGTQGLIEYDYENCWILQEKIDLKLEKGSSFYLEGSNLVVGVHMVKGKIYELCTNGIFKGSLYFTTTIPPPLDILDKVYTQCSILAEYTKEAIPDIWEVEFLVDKNNEVYLSDLNVRFTDSDQVFSIMTKYEFKSNYLEYTFENIEYEKALKAIEENGLLFNKKTKEGIIIEVKFTCSTSVLVLIFADKEEKLYEFYDNCKICLNKIN